MDSAMYEVVLGALLHDIGKLLQRAEEKEYVNQDLESSICPVRNGYYTHKHVLFTDAFFTWMKQQHLKFPDGIDAKTVNTLAINHHRPSDDTPLTQIITEADQYSAGMDRRADEEDDDESVKPQRYQGFKQTPMKSIFDEVILDEKELGIPGNNVYHLGVLNPNGEDDIMPYPAPQGGYIDTLPDDYKRVWDNFSKAFSKLCDNDLPVHLFEEALLGLLERFTWAVPSSTMDCPDISLFDHAKTTAAIAVAMFKYHQAKGQLDNVKAIKDGSIKKFCFLMGDLSGIQQTIFTLEKQGVKGVNKILRARSFMLGAIAEAASLRVTQELGLPFSSVVQQAGGHFLILLPALDDVWPKVNELKKVFDEWVLERYSGTLSLNIALSEPFEGDRFKNGGLDNVLSNLSLEVERAKYNPLSACAHGVMKWDYPVGKACSVCGIRPARNDREDDGRCRTCQREFKLGARLIRSDFLVWSKEGAQDSVELFGIHLSLADRSPRSYDELLSVQQISEHHSESSFWARRYIANYVPILQKEDKYDERLDEMEGLEVIGEGDPKTFAHIAAFALEKDGDEIKGKPFLAIIKADVDFLGFLFSYGLKRQESSMNRLTISRLAQLSRMLNLYFTGYLPGLIQREFPDTYTVYAGGDDLFLISPWRQALSLATRINETFRRYVGDNPNITLSMGISLLHANYPVNRAVEETEGFLEHAKDMGRKRICAMYKDAMTWDEYAKCLKDADWVHDKISKNKEVGTGFVYKILQISDDAKALAAGNISKANWRAKLGYHLIRNVKGKNKEEQRAKAAEWLKRLGMDAHFKGDDSTIIKWRLPLSIALLRNRKP